MVADLWLGEALGWWPQGWLGSSADGSLQGDAGSFALTGGAADLRVGAFVPRNLAILGYAGAYSLIGRPANLHGVLPTVQGLIKIRYTVLRASAQTHVLPMSN